MNYKSQNKNTTITFFVYFHCHLRHMYAILALYIVFSICQKKQIMFSKHYYSWLNIVFINLLFSFLKQAKLFLVDFILNLSGFIVLKLDI